MPTYEYECGKCKKSFELYQSMKDDALKTCPKAQCRMKAWGKGTVRRCLGTGAGLIFKGSGFYITDYRSEGYKASAKSDSAAGEPKKAEPAKAETPAATPAPAAPVEKPAKKKPASK